jgi:transcriptional regulator with XRE-family HTH domain
MTKHEQEALTDQVRRAVNDSPLSRYAICKAAGIDQAVMSRFMAGKAGLSLKSLDALAEVLGLELKLKKRKGKR